VVLDWLAKMLKLPDVFLHSHDGPGGGCILVRYGTIIKCVTIFTGHFVIVPSNFTYLHCLLHAFPEYLLNLI